MFIGHFGVGFGAKRVAPKVSLGALFVAAQFLDLLWPTLLLPGVERVRMTPLIFDVRLERYRSCGILFLRVVSRHK